MSAPTAQRTAPLGVVIGALSSLREAILPAVAIAFSGIGSGSRVAVALGVGLAAVLVGTLARYLAWRRLTYTIGPADIRVERGLISRTARAVPYERIQDVSLEARLVPRLLGLVAVRFETGAGGAEDIKLEYLSAAEGERLRQLVRARREGALGEGPRAAGAAEGEAGEQVLFAMGPRRLLTLGLFEFSLAIFAALGGLLQYLDNVSGIDVWNVELWRGWIERQGSTIAQLGPYAQAAAIIAGLMGLALIGFATGVARSLVRDWGFVLSLSPRGFRRQRGLFTRTDVVMPRHRVQALVIGTGPLRYRFGWHDLRFVSLAQDFGSENHMVAPLARMAEIGAIAEAAGYRLPGAELAWHRASRHHLADSILLQSGALALIAVPVALHASFGLSFIVLGLAVMVAGLNLYAWEFRRHGIDGDQIVITTGFLSPTTRIAKRARLHTAEIAQGPLGRWRGYATLHLGLAGGTLAIPGLALAEARGLRAAILETITAADPAARRAGPADQAMSAAQSGLSASLRAT
ncbi:MAG: PH domain-containing protein [Erythrobacter cryptus]